MLVVRQKKSSNKRISQTHEERGKDENPKQIEGGGGKWDKRGGDTGIGKRSDTNAVINKVKEIENENVGEPAEKAESEEVDGEEEKLDDGREEKIKNHKYKRGNQVSWPGIF